MVLYPLIIVVAFKEVSFCLLMTVVKVLTALQETSTLKNNIQKNRYNYLKPIYCVVNMATERKRKLNGK